MRVQVSTRPTLPPRPVIEQPSIPSHAPPPQPPPTLYAHDATGQSLAPRLRLQPALSSLSATWCTTVIASRGSYRRRCIG